MTAMTDHPMTETADIGQTVMTNNNKDTAPRIDTGPRKDTGPLRDTQTDRPDTRITEKIKDKAPDHPVITIDKDTPQITRETDAHLLLTDSIVHLTLQPRIQGQITIHGNILKQTERDLYLGTEDTGMNLDPQTDDNIQTVNQEKTNTLLTDLHELRTGTCQKIDKIDKQA